MPLGATHLHRIATTDAFFLAEEAKIENVRNVIKGSVTPLV